VAVTRALWGYIEAHDLRLMRRMNDWRPPRWFRAWMLLVTRLGDGWLWYALALVIFFFGGNQRFVALLSAAAAVAAGMVLFRLVNTASRRMRPCHLAAHCWAKILPPDQFSFPSGHTICAFAIAISISHFYPQCYAYLLFLAASIALSRIVLGMHFLSDVLAGAVIGIALAYASVCFFA
jgi:undecaprenyl-diphosphatase